MLSARQIVPWVALVASIAAIGWAVYFPPREEADFTFSNGTEVKSVDPAIVSGQPEGRVISELYEGLIQWDAKDLHPTPGVAERWEISPDGKTFTFHLRRSAMWARINAAGQPEAVRRVTAQDFVYSYQRFLDPKLGAEYAMLLYHVVGAKEFNKNTLAKGDPVEVELVAPKPGDPPFARGEVLTGVLVSEELLPKDAKKQQPVYTVQIGDKTVRYSPKPQDTGEAGVQRCAQVCLPFSRVAITAPDDDTLVMKLKFSVPYFLDLFGFYPLCPVNRECVEQYGYPAWTHVGKLVTNGPYLMQQRLIRDRIRMVKNPHYWDAENVSLKVVDALAIESDTTAINLYCTGKVDYIAYVPISCIPELLKQEREGLRGDFKPFPILTIYYYEFNTKKKELQDPRVRQALNLAIDKRELVERVTLAHQTPAAGFVPNLIPDYDRYRAAHGWKGYQGPDVKQAKELLAEAGYPEGKGLPKIQILFNTLESHAKIAEFIQGQWKKNLNVDVELANREWGTYLADRRKREYTVARAGWGADYIDPNTFLDLFVSDSTQNRSGYKNEKFDKLMKQANEAEATEEDIAAATAEVKAQPAPSDSGTEEERIRKAVQARVQERRMKAFFEAEAILMDEAVMLPLYYNVSLETVRTYVKGFYGNLLQHHPISRMSVDQAEKAKMFREGLKMIGFLFRRGLWMILTLWAVFTISWVLMRNVPGGPFDRERALEPQQIAAMEARYHLDEPLLSQYWRDLSSAARGDLGLSLKTDFHVNEVVAQGLPISTALGVLALFFAIVLGLAAGIVSAVWRGSAFDYALMSLATFGIAIPSFTLGALMIILFAFMWPILPAAGWGRSADIVLPALCLGLPYAASIARLVRTGMLDVLNQDYIRTAYAKGLLPSQVILTHALKGALVPVASFLGPAVAGILTGSLIVEQIFAVPGLGVHFVQAALQRDYTLAMGMVLVYTVLLYGLNTLVDISYSYLDPRVKLE